MEYAVAMFTLQSTEKCQQRETITQQHRDWYVQRPRAAVPVVGFHPCCRRAVSTPTPLGVHDQLLVPSYTSGQRSDGGRSPSLVHVSGTLFHLTLRLPPRWPSLDGV